MARSNFLENAFLVFIVYLPCRILGAHSLKLIDQNSPAITLQVIAGLIINTTFAACFAQRCIA
jgi:hypothetical protein